MPTYHTDTAPTFHYWTIQFPGKVRHDYGSRVWGAAEARPDGTMLGWCARSSVPHTTQQAAEAVLNGFRDGTIQQDDGNQFYEAVLDEAKIDPVTVRFIPITLSDTEIAIGRAYAALHEKSTYGRRVKTFFHDSLPAFDPAIFGDVVPECLTHQVDLWESGFLAPSRDLQTTLRDFKRAVADGVTDLAHPALYTMRLRCNYVKTNLLGTVEEFPWQDSVQWREMTDPATTPLYDMTVFTVGEAKKPETEGTAGTAFISEQEALRQQGEELLNGLGLVAAGLVRKAIALKRNGL